MVKIFSIFHFEFSVYLTKFEMSNPIMGCCQISPGVANLASNYAQPNPLVNEIRRYFFLFFQKFRENLNLKNHFNLKFLILQLGAVRVLSAVTILCLQI